MKNRDLKKQLREECQRFVPDIKNRIMNEIAIESNNQVTKKRNKHRIFLKPAFSLAIVSIFIISLHFLFFNENIDPPMMKYNTYITVNINPAFELELDEDNNIINIRSLNYDAVLILEEIEDLTGQNANEGLSQLIEQSIANGYIDPNLLEEQVIINIINDNQVQEDKVFNLVGGFIRDKYHFSQIIEANEDIKNEANLYNISSHKMILVNQALEMDSTLNINEAVKLSTNKLNEIVNEYQEEELNSFQQAYRKQVNDLVTSRTNMTNTYLSSIDSAYAMLDDIEVLINDESDFIEIKTKIDQFINLYLKEFSYNEPNNDEEYLSLLDQLKIKLDSQQEIIVEMIEFKHNTQINVFKNKISIELKQNITHINFVPDEDYSFSELKSGIDYVEAEIEVLKVIEEMKFLNHIALNNASLKETLDKEVDVLLNTYTELVSSPDISDRFKQNENINDFISGIKEQRGNPGNNTPGGPGNTSDTDKGPKF